TGAKSWQANLPQEGESHRAIAGARARAGGRPPPRTALTVGSGPAPRRPEGGGPSVPPLPSPGRRSGLIASPAVSAREWTRRAARGDRSGELAAADCRRADGEGQGKRDACWPGTAAPPRTPALSRSPGRTMTR